VDADHRIYLTAQAKLAAIILDTQSLLLGNTSVVVTTHFRDSFSACQQAFLSTGVSPFLCQTPFDQDGLRATLVATTPTVALAMASLLPATPLSPPSHASPLPHAWLVIEHYPTPPGDEAILIAARCVPGTSTVRFYDSVDGAFLMRHGGQQVRAIWAMLGLLDDQYLSQPTIARTIRQAQKKIEHQVRSPLSAHSPEAWFQQNLP
jgi:hypothetical protein